MKLKYQQRLEQALIYMETHLDEVTSIAEVCEKLGFSRYHFQRQFLAYCGMTPFRFQQYQRLRRASAQLVFKPESSVTDIAFDAGFANAESFSRAFKREFAQTPGDFRKKPLSQPWQDNPVRRIQMLAQNIEVEVCQLGPLTLGVYEHRGAPGNVYQSVNHFIQWRKRNHLSPQKYATYNLLYDDPDTLPEADYRLGIACECPKPVEANSEGVMAMTLPALEYARLRHIGAWDKLGPKVHYLYYQWLPQSGREPADSPVVLHRLNLYPETPEPELITDIYLPLRD